jgi:SPP1 gp7 family putative phage head morphogenesis protein
LPTQDASISELSKALIERLLKKYLRIFDRDLGAIVLTMMTGVDKASAASLAGSLSKMGESLTISPDYFVRSMGETFKALTTQNVALFKTIASTHFDKVETAVMDSIISGNGLKDLNPFFETHSTGEKNYAKTRAMDQIRKAYTSVNMARMRKLGIKKFEWIHSGGSNNPRILHIELSGKVFEIDNPGELPNCRCMASPLMEFDEDE